MAGLQNDLYSESSELAEQVLQTQEVAGAAKGC